MVVGSNPVEIEVLPLPEAGRPDAFTGLVGRLEVSASIDRTDAETNDALTYRLEVSGTGNIRTLMDPPFGLTRRTPRLCHLRGDREPQRTQRVLRGRPAVVVCRCIFACGCHEWTAVSNSGAAAGLEEGVSL